MPIQIYTKFHLQNLNVSDKKKKKKKKNLKFFIYLLKT